MDLVREREREREWPSWRSWLKWEWRLSIEETERTTTLTLARPHLRCFLLSSLMIYCLRRILLSNGSSSLVLVWPRLHTNYEFFKEKYFFNMSISYPFHFSFQIKLIFVSILHRKQTPCLGNKLKAKHSQKFNS